MKLILRSPAAVTDNGRVRMGDLVDREGNPYRDKDALPAKPEKYNPPRPDDFYAGGWSYPNHESVDE